MLPTSTERREKNETVWVRLATGGTKQIAYVDGQSHMMELFVGFGDLWQSAHLTVLTGAPPPNGSAFAGYAWSAGGTKQVAYRDQKSHIIELFVARGSPWGMG